MEKRISATTRCGLISVCLVACGPDEHLDLDPGPVTPRAVAYNKQTTYASGPGYIAECEFAEVMVPAMINDFDLGWELHNDLESPFLHPELRAELWSFDEDDTLWFFMPRSGEPAAWRMASSACS